MEMSAGRSNYSLLNQTPNQHPPLLFGSASAEPQRASHWDSVDHRQVNRIGLQRQSSESSFGGSSLSGELYASTPSTAAASGIDVRGRFPDAAAVMNSGSSDKSWAQQTEESYQLQLALALRLSSDATRADDPNFLDPMPGESASRSLSSCSAEAVSHRFWVNGCLLYFDKIPDGFYLIHGMDPYVWTVCTDMQENGRIPSIATLKSINLPCDCSLKVVLVDRCSDPILKELQNKVHDISYCSISTTDVVDQLAKLVCNCMGGSDSIWEDDLYPIWRERINDLRDCLGSIVVPIGSLSTGLCRHRAVLFKVLADTIDLPCRIAKGCKYCSRDDASSCLVRIGLDREYMVDLIGKPGSLCEPDSLLNGPSSISFSSPLRFPRLKPAEPTIDFRSLAKQYFSDCMSAELIFDSSSAEQYESQHRDQNPGPIPIEKRSSLVPLYSQAYHSSTHDQGSETFRSGNPPQKFMEPTIRGKDSVPLKHNRPGHRDTHTRPIIPRKPTREFTFDMEDLDIPWADLVLKGRIGSGSFGTVHHAEWNGSEVAVKILMEQDFKGERFKEFLREVAIMKSLRHPNIVLLMGAVTQPPHLSIVTEYLSRGSLYRLLHKPGATEMLDERRRLSMAYDVAKGMNYLHKRNPPIVHRDLKSPNLLVDRKYTVKVSDFGLSRLKANTFLSSKSAAGTPEWMAPEVLRDEPSNEKSDVYSFGVILWELATLQQPWSNLNPPQVVAAVGFKGKRLEIPPDLNPQLASIIEACWANEPWKRPSFSSIMDSLNALLKPPTPQPGHPNMQLLT
ncbi:hypothetical protein Fmac_006464 [Flemingia macrophylla]|uniref:non-specific serine/threonine protein kinase n=1 Tax=Flemingia macrophylla TaxID=520843 RepID=A0ABD1NAS7_9FABA